MPLWLAGWDMTALSHKSDKSHVKCRCGVVVVVAVVEMNIGGVFFIPSERSDRSSPVCLSFFYSSEHFVPRFFMTD